MSRIAELVALQRMTRRAAPFLLCSWAIAAIGCFDSDDRDPRDTPPPAADAAMPPPAPPTPPGTPPVAPPTPPASPPVAPPPPAIVPPGDISVCADAPMLPLDGAMRGIEPRVGDPGPESCWSGSSTFGYLRLLLPAHTGVTITTRGVAPPVPNVTDGCTPNVETGECRYLGPNGFFGPDAGEHTHYVGNSTDTDWSLVVGVWWGQDWPRSTFDVETRSVALPREASCGSPRVLPAGERVVATEGGFFDSCGNADNGLFFHIEVPPMTRAVPIEGTEALAPIGSCGCAFEPGASYESALENLSDAPIETLIFAQSYVGYAIEPMPASARCDTAPTLPIDGSDLTFDMDFAGHSVTACERSFSDGAHYARVEAPAGTTIRVTARFDSPGPEQGILVWARTSCDVEECAAFTDSFLGSGSEDLLLTAPADASGSWVVGLAMTALPFPDQIARISATIEPAP